MNLVRIIVCLSMYRVAFKYNPRIVTDNSAYPWKIPENKYALDRKILAEEGYATVDRKRMSQWLMMDPKTHMRVDSKKVKPVLGVEQMQMNRNASLNGAVPMNRGQNTHVAGMFAMPQQGGGQSGNHTLSSHDSTTFSNATHVSNLSVGNGGIMRAWLDGNDDNSVGSDANGTGYFGNPFGSNDTVAGNASLGSHHSAESMHSFHFVRPPHLPVTDTPISSARMTPTRIPNVRTSNTKIGTLSYNVPPMSPTSKEQAIRVLFPERHPQMGEPDMSVIMSEIKRRHPNHPYFNKDSSTLSIGKPKLPNFFPADVENTIQPIQRLPNRTPPRKTNQRLYYPESESAKFSANKGPSSFAGVSDFTVRAPSSRHLIDNTPAQAPVPKAPSFVTQALASLLVPIIAAVDPKYAPLWTNTDKKQDASMMSIDVDVLNASGIAGLDSRDELSMIEPLEIHDDLPVKSNMVDHDFLGKKPTHRVAPSLDLNALAHEIQLEIENDAVEQGIVFNDAETKSLSQQAAENLLGRSMKKWKSDKFWNQLQFKEDPKWRRRKSLMGKSTERRSRISLYRMATAYIEKEKNKEVEKAVASIKANPRNPSHGIWHREHSTRLKGDDLAKHKAQEVEARQQAELAEFEQLDNINHVSTLSDEDYFRWVFLHPQWTLRQKTKATNDRKAEIKARKKAEKERDALQSTKDIVSSLMSSASNVVTKARRASSSHPIVNAAKVTVRRKGKITRPPRVSSVASTSKLKKTTSQMSFGSWT